MPDLNDSKYVYGDMHNIVQQMARKETLTDQQRWY